LKSKNKYQEYQLINLSEIKKKCPETNLKKGDIILHNMSAIVARENKKFEEIFD
jgi:hypothetical protein